MTEITMDDIRTTMKEEFEKMLKDKMGDIISEVKKSLSDDYRSTSRL